MKHLKLKKIKVAKINNLHMILGGHERQSIVEDCASIPEETYTCPEESREGTECTTGTNGLTLKTQMFSILLEKTALRSLWKHALDVRYQKHHLRKCLLRLTI